MKTKLKAMKMHISQSTKELLHENSYKIVERGKIDIKGKGEMKTYFVLSKFDDDGKSLKCPFMEIYEEFKKNEESKQQQIDQPNFEFENDKSVKENLKVEEENNALNQKGINFLLLVK